MSQTGKLGLPYIVTSQAQKEVTHNEALSLLDIFVQAVVTEAFIDTPPPSPTLGECMIIGSAPTGEWENHAGKLAQAITGGWRLVEPFTGMAIYNLAEGKPYRFDGNNWHVDDETSLQNIPMLGINATADSVNKLAVASSDILFNHIGNSVQMKFNKQSATDTASLLYQTNWSGRAEFGLTGDDDFHVKVSPDGSMWHDAFVVDRRTGAVDFTHPITINGSVQVQAGAQGRNYLLNGNFDIWQRGVSTTINHAYLADRWFCTAGDGARTCSRQAFANGQSQVSGNPRYCLRHAQTGAASSSAPSIQQRIEYVHSLAGQEVTLSFEARVVSGSLTISPFFSQYFGTGGTPSVAVSTGLGSHMITTNWQRFTATAILPGLSGKIIGSNGNDYLNLIFLLPTGIEFTVDLANVKLEAGSVATPFVAPHLADELARCQRYYCKTFPQDIAPAQNAGIQGSLRYRASNTVFGSGNFGIEWHFPVTMRSAPTLATYNPNAFNNAWRNLDTLTDYGLGVNATSDHSATIHYTGGTANAFHQYAIHATADAEL